MLTVVHLFLGLTSGVSFTGHVDTSQATLDLPWYQHPAVGLSLMGIAYSFYAAAVWPAVVYVVDDDQVGTAYGLVTAVQNTGLFLVPVIVGTITDDTPDCDPSKDSGGYFKVEMMFVALGALGVVFGTYLHMLPAGRKLNARDPWAAGIAETDSTPTDAEHQPLPASEDPPPSIQPKPRKSDHESEPTDQSEMA